jgi:hypothetical protein
VHAREHTLPLLGAGPRKACSRYSAGDRPRRVAAQITALRRQRHDTRERAPGHWRPRRAPPPRRCVTTRRPERSTDHAAPAEQRHPRWLLLPRVEQLQAAEGRIYRSLICKERAISAKEPSQAPRDAKTGEVSGIILHLLRVAKFNSQEVQNLQ